MNPRAHLRLVTFVLAILSISGLARSAYSQQEEGRSAFLEKYLSNPFSPLSPTDTHFNEDIYLKPVLANGTLSDIDLDRIEFRDINSDGFADIIVPCNITLPPPQPNAPPTSVGDYMVIVNTKVPRQYVLKNGETETKITQRFDINPLFLHQTLTATQSATAVKTNLFADLNGDGLTDIVSIKKGTAETIAQGRWLQLTDARVNVGFGFITPGYLPSVVLDARLGYIASYSATVLQSGTRENLPRLREVKAELLRTPNYDESTATKNNFSKVQEELKKGDPNRVTDRINRILASIPESARKEFADTSSAIYPSRALTESNRASGVAVPDELNYAVIYGAQYTPYVPDSYFYSLGVNRGKYRAYQDGAQKGEWTTSLAEGNRVQQTVAQLPKPDSIDKDRIGKPGDDTLSKLVSGATDLLDVSNVLKGKIRSTASSKPMSVYDLPSLGLTSYDATRPVFSVVPPDIESATMPEDVQLKALCDAFTTNWLVGSEKYPGRSMGNCSRVTGMALAFLNLNIMRANSENYIGDLRNDDKYRRNQSVVLQGMLTFGTQNLGILSQRFDRTKTTYGEFTIASMSTGYSELSQLYGQDRVAAAYQAGYLDGLLKGRQDAFKEIQQGLGGLIPGIQNAKDISDVVKCIASHVEAQRDEIQQLKSQVTTLNLTVQKLNGLLDASKETIELLRRKIESLEKEREDLAATLQEVRETLDAGRRALDEANQTITDLRQQVNSLGAQLQRALEEAADAARQGGAAARRIGRLADAGTGFLIGGPAGAAIGALGSGSLW